MAATGPLTVTVALDDETKSLLKAAGLPVSIYKISLVLERTDTHGTVLNSQKYGARFIEDAPDLAAKLSEYAANTVRRNLPAFLEAAK